MLEGSLRKAGDRIRITGQLIEASTGAHLWAERFEGELDDIFELQDEIAAGRRGRDRTASRIGGDRARQKQTDGQSQCLRLLPARDRPHAPGHAGGHRGGACPCFSKSIELDPEFAAAHAMAAWCVFLAKDQRLDGGSRAGVRPRANGWRAAPSNWAGTMPWR